MQDPDREPPSSHVTYSMLVSESIYRLVVLIERLIRWSVKILRPRLFALRILLRF